MSMFHELMMRKKEQIMYATIKGTLTENNGVFSGFSASNYLQIQNSVSITQSSNLEFYFKFTTPASFSYAGNYPVLCRLNNGNKVSMLGFYNSSGNIYARGSIAGNNIEDYSYTPQTNTTYYIKLTYANGVETLTLYDVDKNVLLTKSQSITITDVTETLYVGVTSGSHQGTMQSIDLNNSYIKLGSTKYNLQAVVGYTIVGSPTIVDGVVSGFSSGNYLLLGANVPYSNNFEMVFKITTGSSFSSTNTIFEGSSTNNGLSIAINTSKYLYISAGNGSWIVNTSGTTVLSTNTTYYVKFSYKNGVYKLELSTDNINWNTEISVESSSVLVTTSAKSIGYSTRFSGRVFSGSIDMNETYIKINNKLWFNGQQA